MRRPNLKMLLDRLTSHEKSRNGKYCGLIDRFDVPTNAVDWSTPLDGYRPIGPICLRYKTAVGFVDEAVAKTQLSLMAAMIQTGKDKRPVWSDPWIEDDDFDEFMARNEFNSKNIAKHFNRKSYHGDYSLQPMTSSSSSAALPRNPIGRTGLEGIGILGKWGPNHAADPVVTRFNGDVLEFIAIQRKDNNEWAIPGGMVDVHCGEDVSVTLFRELAEEAFDAMNKAEANEKIRSALMTFDTKVVYQGYVDDPRNTDNAWMETHVVNFHDSGKDASRSFQLRAGDDAGDVKWMPLKLNSGGDGIDGEFYASHAKFLLAVYKLHHPASS